MVILLLSVLPWLSACSSRDEDRWQDASGAQEFFRDQLTQRALGENEIPELSRQCEDLLPEARAALDDPGSPGSRVLIDVCAKARMGLGDELRCVGETLQLRCL